MKKLEDYVITIPDFPEEGILFRDVTGILQSAEGFKLAIDELAKLLEGVEATVAIDKLKGNKCGMRDTSCADQLTKALEKALAE